MSTPESERHLDGRCGPRVVLWVGVCVTCGERSPNFTEKDDMVFWVFRHKEGQPGHVCRELHTWVRR